LEQKVLDKTGMDDLYSPLTSLGFPLFKTKRMLVMARRTPVIKVINGDRDIA
jgi:hypothetical protein